MSAASHASTSTSGRSLGTALFARPAAGADGRTGPGALDPRTSRARLILCALALGLAPVLLVIASLVSISTSDNAAQGVADVAADRNQFVAGNILFLLGAAALIPGALALASLVRARGSAWMTTGASMMALGGGSIAIALWSYTVVGFLGTESGVARDAAVAMFDHGDSSLLFGAAWVIGTGALLGMIIAAIGLIRARSVPLWEPVLLIIAPVVSFFGENGVLGAALSIPLAIALIALAYEVLRMVGRSRTVAEPAAAGGGSIDLTEAGMPAPRQGVEHSGTRNPAAGSTSVG